MSFKYTEKTSYKVYRTLFVSTIVVLGVSAIAFIVIVLKIKGKLPKPFTTNQGGYGTI